MNNIRLSVIPVHLEHEGVEVVLKPIAQKVHFIAVHPISHACTGFMNEKWYKIACKGEEEWARWRGKKLIFQLNLNSLPRLSRFAARLRAYSKLEEEGKFE